MIMLASAVLALLQAGASPEVLPVDQVIDGPQRALFAEILPQMDAQMDRMGPAEPGWATSGLSKEAAIAARNGTAEQHVLGEWDVGGHNASTVGDQPLVVPQGMRRYTVREYAGPIAYHGYFRYAPGIVIHTFGANRQVGNAQCSSDGGVEVISRDTWQSWSDDVRVVVFAVAQAMRNDRRTYCDVYHPTEGGRFRVRTYSPDGRPFLFLNDDNQAYRVTTRAEATGRIFASGARQPAPD